MSLALLGAVALASLTGSLHCAGMCGGLAAFASADRTSAALYHSLRAASYLTLGALAGWLGSAIDFGGDAVGWSQAAMALAGITMLGLGLVALWRARGRKLPKLPTPRFLKIAYARLHRWASVQPRHLRAAWLGALTALLPCGWLYAFLLVAAGAGSPLGGAAVMLAFWAGTVPALLVVAFGARTILRPLAQRAPTLSAWALVVLGTSALLSRGQVHAFAGRVDAAQTPQEVRELSDITPPCCADEEEQP